MIEQSPVKSIDASRAMIAGLMAQYEIENGPIETTPIRAGDPAAVQHGTMRSIQIVAEERRAQRKANLEALRATLDAGGSVEDSIKQTGLTRRYVLQLIRDHGLKVK